MTKKTLHIALAQVNPTLGNLPHNSEKIIAAWKDAKNADLVVFPEMVICGYPPEDLVLKPFFLEEVEYAIQALVKESKNHKPAVLISTPWRIDNKTYSAVHLIQNGKILATRTKCHLPNYGVFDEGRIFTPGELPSPIEFNGVKLGVMVCEDMWYEDVAAHLKKQGAELFVIPNGSPFDLRNRALRMESAKKRAKENNIPLLYVNQVGGQDELVFDGMSFALNESANIVMQGEEFAEGIYHITLEKNGDAPWLMQAQDLVAESQPLESIYNALVLGLRDYISKNNFPGVIIGLSGGIDSALSAIIAVDALGAEAVRCVMMPSEFTAQESLDDANEMAEILGVHLDNIAITEPVQMFNELLEPHFNKGTPGITYENIQPRSRGIILMALSNATGAMVLSTGNKSEMGVGYATLYGDMCGGFNVLKDIYKTQVYELSNWRNQNKPKGVFGPEGRAIPENIITRAPTAELKHNQTDQDSLPPYDKLDDILACLIEWDMGLAEIVKRGHAKETVQRVWKMLDRAEYKRRQAPPGIKITSRAFGRDRRYPITNHFVNIIEKA